MEKTQEFIILVIGRNFFKVKSGSWNFLDDIRRKRGFFSRDSYFPTEVEVNIAVTQSRSLRREGRYKSSWGEWRESPFENYGRISIVILN